MILPSNLSTQAIDILLRGISQVVLQNNPVSGLVILVGLFIASKIAGVATLVGVIISTLTAVLLKVDKSLIQNGLFGFNGVLVGIGVSSYAVSHHLLIDHTLWLHIVIATSLSTLVMIGLSQFFTLWNLPALTMPFILCTWLFIGVVEHIDLSNPMATLSHHFISEIDIYTIKTWYIGVGKGFSEIFLQDSAIAGYLIFLGILINSRMSAIAALAAALLSIATGIAFEVSEESIQLGLYSYNPILTSIALGGGLFIYVTKFSFIYALLGAIVTTWISFALSTALQHLELPIYTFPFVITTWFMLLVAMSVNSLKYISTSEATTPEENTNRYDDL
ncbi:urea transporter [Candidatus Nitrosacidococcus tergens]|uniref:Urea transporter n=1 Tax=Candidatus Nitrosacidococcus tergens TaxID=553981 RepID=A0A7G1Q8H7_9GAMM|nr:urea transporter [Candidatus Nitrosacidococcus tergens]CAB1275053.1 Urea transporter [Candidatus Nitrosacidococcus tergens]